MARPRPGHGILVGPLVWAELAWMDDLGAGYRLRILGDAADELHCPIPQSARDRQLVEAERGGGCLEGGGYVDSRVEADAAGDRQRLAHRPGLFEEDAYVPARAEAHADGVGAVYAHAMDGYVRDLRLGVFAPEQAEIEVRAGILGRALDGGDGGAKVNGGLTITSWQGA